MKAMQPIAPVPAQASAGGHRLVQRKCACGGATSGGDECESCGKKKLQRSAAGGNAPPVAPPIVGQVVGSGGRPLDGSTRGFMESRLGHDFGDVRVHSDSRAAESARSVNALAYTVGRDVVFDSGRFAPATSEGRKLLAHELTHVVQQRGSVAASGPLRIAEEPALEREAESTGERAVSSGARHGVMRATAGWTSGGKPVGGVNAGEQTIAGMRRIPIEGLTRGNQAASLNSTGQSAAGRAIVYLQDGFDETQATQVLLHFHGWGGGYRSGGKGSLDQDINLPQQMRGDINTKSPIPYREAQMMAILPQGDVKAKFGNDASGNPGFDSDGYINEVLAKLVTQGYFTTAPTVSKVLLSGHSGSGEMINEQMLGPGVGAPSKLGGVFLFDAVNGPNEFRAIKNWLDRTLTSNLSEVTSRTTDDEKLAFLADSMRFRLYASEASNGFYTKWAFGPVPPAKPGDPPLGLAISPWLDDWFATNAAALGGTSSPVYAALRANFQVIRPGHAVHDEVISRGDRMQESLATVQRAPASDAASTPAMAPPAVHRALATGGRPLGVMMRAHAESHMGHDFGGVQIHADGAAAESARQVNARAYTVGQHVVFGAGEYAPQSAAGRSLLMHELAHTAQQRSVRSIPAAGSLPVGPAGGAYEREAQRVAAGDAMHVGAVSAPIIQRVTQEEKRAMACEDSTMRKVAKPGDCIYAEPENCGTYEEWISTFVRLKTFEARTTPDGSLGNGQNTFNVIGDGAGTRPDVLDAERKEVADLSKGKKGETPDEKTKREADLAAATKKLATLEGNASPERIGAKRAGEEFIDHPTDTWVKNCLPANLRPTAYQLPSDCADIAIILRHVWLSAHHRTETFGSWTIGDKAGGPQTSSVGKVISEVNTQTVGQMTNQYLDAAGKPLLSFAALEPLLHPGDVLVWEHRKPGITGARQGGHTLTLSEIDRDQNGNITRISALQGNLPIFGESSKIDPKDPDFAAKTAGDDKGAIIKKTGQADTPGLRTALGTSPGRRIETSLMTRSGGDFTDAPLPAKKKGDPPTQIWGWGTSALSSTAEATYLVAAGAPKAGKRPGIQKGNTQRMITDWTPSFKSATADSIVGLFDAMLHDTRGLIEGGGTVADADAKSVGEAAGQRLWSLAKKAKDLGNESHFQPLTEMRNLLSGIRASRDARTDKGAAAATKSLKDTFGIIDEAFELAARGGADISFTATVPKGKKLMKFLVTGFDPFNGDDVRKKPERGDWNPSGSAALALDGQSLTVGDSVVAIESIVLPVDFGEFSSGIAEKLVQPYAAGVDAVITVSLDGSIKPGDPVRLEKYAVGVREIWNGSKWVKTPVPVAPGGTEGAEIIKTSDDLETIAKGAEKPAKGGVAGIPKPVIGNWIEFDFPGATEADTALAALGLPKQRSSHVKIDDQAALDKIINGTTNRSGITITFTVGTFTGTANVAAGPGGNFLSNEISYRMKRLLGTGAGSPVSFHVHTQGGNRIPDSGADRAKETRSANAIRTTLIETLQRIVKSTAQNIIDKRP